MESNLERALRKFSELIKINGTGESFKTPVFYKFLVSYIRIIGRSLTRVNYSGIEKIPKNGPVIIVGNHISNIDPIVKIMGIGRPVHYLAKEGHFTKEPNRTIMKRQARLKHSEKLAEEMHWQEQLMYWIPVYALAYSLKGQDPEIKNLHFYRKGKLVLLDYPLVFRMSLYCQWQ
jgi:hypothetical protein